METTSILNILREDSVISLKKYEVIDRKNYQILIVPETGAWATIGKSDENTLMCFSEHHTAKELKAKGAHNIEKLLNDLFYSGILTINGKDVSMIQKHDENMKYKKGCDLPLFIVLKYTNACNLKCAYCYSYDRNKTNIVAIPNEYVYKLSQLIGDTEKPYKLSICFHGGEPLTRFKDIVECVDTLKKRRNNNVEFSIQTNGTLLTSKIASYLKKEDIAVGISVDGYDEETNHLRLFANNKSSINSTLNAIRICQKVGLTPGIISVMTRNNYKNVIEIMTHLSQMGIKAFHFNHFLPTGRGEKKEKDFSVPIQDILDTRIQMLLFINDYNSTKGIDKRINERFTHNILLSLVKNEPLTYMCAQSPCGAGRKQLALTYDGSIYPCDDLCNESLFKIGNVNEITNIRQVLSSSESVKICQSHCIQNIKECRKCIYRKICISHCCSDSYFYTGGFNSPHSTCAMIKQFIPTIIDLLYRGRIQIENIIY